MAVHVFDGFMAAGTGHRAVCACGWFTDPPAGRSQAAADLAAQHDLSPPVCASCGRRSELNQYGTPRHLVLILGPGGQLQLECADHHADVAPRPGEPAALDGPVLHLL